MTFLAIVLLTTGANAQSTEQFYYNPKLSQVENSVVKNQLANSLRSPYFSEEKEFYGKPQNVLVFDNRFELTFKKYHKTIYFSDILDPIRVTVTHSELTAATVTYYYSIRFGDYLFSWPTGNPSNASIEKLADYLFFFQYPLIVQRYDSLIANFKPLAAQSRALKVKPSISEEQRKFIVQANVLTEQKMYENAIKLYNKVLEIDQTAYPAAYSNLALLSAQIQDFQAAIYHMKKYLLLEPEAPDARSSQDKIYEWEIMMQK